MQDDHSRLVSALGDRYRIGRELGSGGMAIVFLADDLKHGRQVAVKVLRPELAASIGGERFLREIEIAARLQHPHILPLLDSGEAAGCLYYVMPYVEGESLRCKLTRERELPIADVVHVLHDVVDALSCAHQHGVVHRDVKPENVLLSGRHAVVADFGIAKAVSEATGSHRLTSVGIAIGTPAYMAPEQVSGDTGIDARADIYAVGVLAFELLAGRPPFEGTSQAVLAAHMTRTPEPVTSARPQVPPTLSALIARCLEKDPSDRWQRADDLLPLLESIVTSSGDVTPVVTLPERGRFHARLPRPVLAAAGLLLLAVLGAAVARYGVRQPMAATRGRIVVVPPENRTGNKALDHLSMTSADWLARGLLATKLLEVVPGGTALLARDAIAAQPSGNGASLSRRLAKETGAQLVVSGAYYGASGDSIRFELQLADVATDRLLASIDPVTVPADDVMAGFVTLGSRVSGAVGKHLDPAFANPILSSPPPSYEAYRLMTEASRVWMRDLSEAERLTRQALATDSSYQSARAFLALTLLNQNRAREGDSVLRIAESDQSELSPGERAGLDWQRGLLNGDQARMYRAAKRMTEVDPSMLALWILGFETARLNRPRESVAIHARIDPFNVQMDYNPSYWTTLTDAQHMLAEHDREGEAAIAARKQYPALLSILYLQGIALAAQGRASEAERLLEESVDLPAQGEITPGIVGRDIGLELRAHGDPNGARRASAWAVRWYEALPQAQRRSQQREYAEALYAAERWGDADRALNESCGNTTTDLRCLGMSGAIAARLGHRDAAHQISERISAVPFYPPREESTALEQQAHIAAALGDRERALRLLRQAISKGLWYSSALHRQPDLQLLSDYPPFVEFLRPKG